MAGDCKCISYNRPAAYQAEPSVALIVPAKFGDLGSETVMIDACIVHIVQALWDADIWTLGSCCGHNESHGEHGRSIIVDRADRERAAAVIREMGDDMHVAAWELVWGDSVSRSALEAIGEKE